MQVHIRDHEGCGGEGFGLGYCAACGKFITGGEYGSIVDEKYNEKFGKRYVSVGWSENPEAFDHYYREILCGECARSGHVELSTLTHRQPESMTVLDGR